MLFVVLTPFYIFASLLYLSLHAHLRVLPPGSVRSLTVWFVEGSRRSEDLMVESRVELQFEEERFNNIND